MTPSAADPLLLEAATTAWRPRDPDGLALPHPAWADLLPEQRAAAFDAATAQRAVEAALDPQGWSGTVHAVLARIR